MDILRALKFAVFTLKTRKLEKAENIVSESCLQESNQVEEKLEKIKINLSDPDHKKIICDILDLYGYPISSESCISKQEKIMHVFGLMATVQGLNRDSDLTSYFFFKEEIENSTELFCEEYYNRYGHHVIPNDTECEAAEVFQLLKTGVPSDKNTKLESIRSKEED